MNFSKLLKYIVSSTRNHSQRVRNSLIIDLFDKIALPITTIALVIVGVPLAITPPRVRYNRGFLFSILIIFAYYLIRALSISFGEAGTLNPFLAAWMPNIILTGFGFILYYKKVYTISQESIPRIGNFYKLKSAKYLHVPVRCSKHYCFVDFDNYFG